MGSRILLLLASTAVVAGLAVLILSGIAAYDARVVVTTAELVQAGAAGVELELERQAQIAPELAMELGADDELATDMRTLSAVINLVPPNGRTPERLRVRVEGLRTKLIDRLAAAREQRPGIDGFVLTDDAGVVLISDVADFAIGSRLPAPKDVEGEGALDEADAPQPAAAAKPADGADSAPAEGEPGPATAAPFVLTALTGKVQQLTLADEAGVRWLGAAPTDVKGKLVGAVIVVSKLQSLPRPPGADALLLLGDEVRFGREPMGFDRAAVGAGERPFMLVPRRPGAVVPVLEALPIPPMFVDMERVGVWAQRFEVPGAPAASGLVFADVSPLYGELAGFQVMALLALLLVWMGHVAVVLLSGRRLRAGIGRIADFLGRLHQGVGEERHLNERSLPSELTRLVRLVNKTVEQQGGATAVAPLPKSPSLDEVLKAQGVASPPDIADLEFEGITNSGSLEMGGADPFGGGDEQEDDGYEGLGDMADSAAAEVSQLEAAEPAPEQLPGLPEAFDALDHLTDAAAPDGSRDAPAVVAALEAGEQEPDASPLLASLDDEPPPQPAGDAEPTLAPMARAALADVEAVLAEAGSATADLMSRSRAARPAGGFSNNAQAALGDLLDESAPDATTTMQLTPELIAAVREASVADSTSQPVPFADASVAHLDHDVPGAAQPATAAAGMPAAAADPTATHFRDVFEEFIRTRRSCGEESGDLTFEKFSDKLTKSRDAVIAKHQCNDVRFQVYVKNGKAALKALPAR